MANFRVMSVSRRSAAVLLLLAAVGAHGVAAQIPGQIQQEDEGWAPPSLGVRVGFDNKQRDEMLGAQLRIPIIPTGEIEVMPSMDVTFLPGIKEYQYNFEAVYVLDGRRGGLYGGAGLGLRNSIFASGQGRSTELGYTAVVGFRLVGLGHVVPQLEYRWIFIREAPITYQQLALGFNMALWSPIPRQ